MSTPTKRVLHFIINSLINGIVLFVSFHTIMYLIVLAIPSSVIFEYKSIEPMKLCYEHGEPLILHAKGYFQTELPVKRVDTLNCPPVNFVSQSVVHGERSRGELDQQWQYQKELPQYDTECFMDIVITAKVWYGIEKTQHIVSSSFTIK